MNSVTCPGCRGEVVIPDKSAFGDVFCPKCHQLVYAVDIETRATWKPGPPAPAWMMPVGALILAIGLFGFAASFVHEGYQGGSTAITASVAGAMNPLFLVGFPVGAYWLIRAKKL